MPATDEPLGEDDTPHDQRTPTPRVALPAPQPTGWTTPANIQALRASEATNGAFSPSVLASGASSPAPESTATPRAPPARRSSKGAAAAAAKLTGATAFKRMFGSGNSTPAATPPIATRTPSTETTQDSLLSKHPPPTPDSESETTSERFRSNPPSRAQSFSSEVRPGVRTPSRPPSVSGESAHKFNLKDLLASAPKPARKSSTGGSRKSDGGSEYGGAKSVASGASGGQLNYYGTCERVAIGKGATSIVKLAHKWDRTEEKLYAVKEFRKRRKNETEKEYVKKLTAEFCISSALHHINVVETVDLVKDENQHWCEVMEYCPGGDLYAAIKRGGMSPSEVECCFKQVLQGVEYLHSQGVAHRDIKPENLFFNQYGHLKIGDYGASTVYRLPWEKNIHMSTGLCGSEPYIAPEQFTPGPYDARLVDIWACGIVYYCLHFQELPWRVAQPSDPLFQAYLQACSAKPQQSVGPNSPASAQQTLPTTISNLSPRACRPLLRKMLDPNPKLRIQIEEIMKDSWLATVEVCTDPGKKPGHVHAHAQSRAAQLFEGR